MYHRWYIEVFHLPPHVPQVVQPPLAAIATPVIGGFPVTPRLCIGATVITVTAVKSGVYCVFYSSHTSFLLNKNVCPPKLNGVVEVNYLTQRHMYQRWYILCMATGGKCCLSNIAIHAEICLSTLIFMTTHKKSRANIRSSKKSDFSVVHY